MKSIGFPPLGGLFACGALTCLLIGQVEGQSAPAAASTRAAATKPGADATVQRLIAGMRAEIRASRSNDRAGMKAAQQELRKLASPRFIEEQVRKMPALKSILGDDVVGGFVSLWSPSVAYYIDEIDLAQSVQATSEHGGIDFRIPARHGGERAIIQVRLVQEPGEGTWRVVEVSLQPDQPPARPPAPASAPTRAPGP